MNICEKCNTEISDESVSFCPHCGTPMHTSNPEDDDLEFEIHEAHSSEPEFVGGSKAINDDTNDLGIEANSDLMEQEALNEAADNSPFDTPIGDSEPSLPPSPDSMTTDGTVDTGLHVAGESSPMDPSDKSGKDAYLSDDEKEQLIKKLEAARQPTPAPEDNTVEATGLAAGFKEEKMSAPKITNRGLGVAYFYKCYVELISSQTLHAGDELSVDGRDYELRPKKFNTKLIVGSSLAAFVLLMIVVVSQFMGVDSGRGQIFGMVADDLSQPYLQGATVRLSELGKSCKSNAQGFFVFEDVPAGAHRVEFRIDGEVIGEDFATVVSDKASMLVLYPAGEVQAATSQETAVEQPVRVATTSQKPEITKTSSSSQTNTKPRKKKSNKPSYAKLQLEANIEGARLKLDGKTIGAGNMTFSKLSPGNYKYTIDADGYQTETGSIKLSGGKTEVLIVNLESLSQEEIRADMTASDLYELGMENVRGNNLRDAVKDFSEALDRQPDHTQVLMARAEVNADLGDSRLAQQDYLAAAEAFRAKSDANHAISAYNKVLQINDKSIKAYLGRGDIYLAMGQEIAALADFEAARKIDKNSAHALFGLGRCRFGQGNYKKAIGYFDNARKQDPSNPLVYQYLMLSYAARDDDKKVMKTFGRYRDVATETQLRDFLTNSEFSSVTRIIEKN